MKTWFFSWVRTVLICMVGMQLLLQFVVEENSRKYIRLFLSLVFLLVLFRPVLTVFQLSENLDQEIEDWLAGWESRMTAEDTLGETGEENTLIEQAVREKLEEDIRALLQEEGLQLESLELAVDAGESNMIRRISLTARAKTGSSATEETIGEQLRERYELTGDQVAVVIRQ